MRTIFCAAGCVTILLASLAHAQHDEQGLVINYPDRLKWQPGPASLAKGSQIAVLEGDPNKEGPFVFRLKLPDGFRVAPHTHPKMERVTVIAGTLNIGMGEKFDAKATKAMPAGAFGTWEAEMKHFAWVKGETIIQLHGTGPWTIKYLNPADDPRTRRK
jgi:hypothetical protein